MTTAHRPYSRYGYPAWRTLIKASDDVTFHDVARLANVEYDTVYKMSHGHIRTSDAVWDALAKLTGHSAEDLREATAIRMELVTEGGES